MSLQSSSAEDEIPALPMRPPDRFQFHLKHLLAFMLASAFVASGMRLILALLNRLPEGALTGWSAVLLGGLAFGAAAYFCLRGPYLVMGMLRASHRWDAIHAHRRELAKWADTRRSERGRIMHKEDEGEA